MLRKFIFTLSYCCYSYRLSFITSTTNITFTVTVTIGEEVDLEDYVTRPDKISAADIASICQEAGKRE